MHRGPLQFRLTIRTITQPARRRRSGALHPAPDLPPTIAAQIAARPSPHPHSPAKPRTARAQAFPLPSRSDGCDDFRASWGPSP